MKLSELAIKNYQFTIILILLLVLSGIVSFQTMPRSEDPQVAPHGSSVIVLYPGAGPADMEQLIVDPIEEKLNELDDIKHIISQIRDGLGVIEVEFETGTDMDETYSEIVQKINSIRSQIPDDIMDLRIIKWVLSDYVIILQVALISDTASYRILDDEAERLEKGLEKIAGVKKVRKWAVPDQQVLVSLDLEKLAQKRISMNHVIQAIQATNINIPGGHIDIGQKRFNIKTSGSYESLDAIENTIVHASGDKVVFLKDIADVRFEYEDDMYFARAGGQRAVFITVNQKEGTNIFDVMDGVNTVLEEFQEKLPPSISLSTIFNQSKSVSKRLDGFFMNLLQGLILVGIVVLLAVGFRASIIVMLAIPVSIFTALGFVDMSGFGLQMMTISGFVIALGLLVDNAIVVTENISRFMKQGYSQKDSAVKGTSQIGWAIISATATTILAFLPIAAMGYTSGEYIRSMPVTVIFTLAASLLIALTLTPYLSSRFLTREHCCRENLFRKFLNASITKFYIPNLRFAIGHPKLLSLLMLAIFLISLFMFQFVGISFFPKAEKAQIILNIDTPEGYNLEKTDSVTRYVEAILAEREEIVQFASTIGRGGPQIHYGIESKEATASHAQIYIELKDRKPQTLNRIVSDLRLEFRDYIGAKIEIKELEQGPPVEAPIAIKIMGENLDILRTIARDVEGIFEDTPGTVNILNPQKTTKTDLHIKINKAKAGMLGIPMVEIDRTVRAAITGMTVSQYRDTDGKEYDITVRLPFRDKPRIEDFNRIYLTSMMGTHVPLKQIATISFKSEPEQIDHYNFDRTVTITSDIDVGYSTNGVTKKIIQKLDLYEWPKGYDYYVAGSLETQQESFGGMGQAIIIAMIAIFAVLVLQFRSFSQPIIVFVTIPLAIIGSIYALLITGNPFSFTAFIGLTSLVGIVVNNAIILVDYTNQLRRDRKPLLEALIEAGETRFIPIILTTATTIGGLLPLTLRGGTLYAPMGWTIIGGLLVSTFLTLIIVPVMYVILSKKGELN
ncbi:efflux RND transporter permease subunit [Acidobacteriota bacterium]